MVLRSMVKLWYRVGNACSLLLSLSEVGMALSQYLPELDCAWVLLLKSKKQMKVQRNLLSEHGYFIICLVSVLALWEIKKKGTVCVAFGSRKVLNVF